MSNYVINYGSHPTTPTEQPILSASMTEALLAFDRLAHMYERVTLHRLGYGDDGKVNNRSLLKSKGLPVDGMTKVKLPTPKVAFSDGNDHFCWVCEHSTIGIRVLADGKLSATDEFVKALKREAGGSDLPVKLLEFEGEFFYGRKGAC